MDKDDAGFKLLVNQIRNSFPDEAKWVDSRMRAQGWENDEAHCVWIEQFSQCTSSALKVQDNNKALSYLLFISNILNTADNMMSRCIDVYYV
jgi:hypothetical protein